MYEIKGKKMNNQDINNLINELNLKEKLDSLCGTLSGGQKRKLCIILSLISESKIILLDEPTSGMDITSKIYFLEFLKKYKRDKIIIYITHLLDEAEYLGDMIGILKNGKLICSGTKLYIKSKLIKVVKLDLILENFYQYIFKIIKMYLTFLNLLKNQKINMALMIIQLIAPL